MDIHEAAKRLRELGIPGKEKEKAIEDGVVKTGRARVEKAIQKYVEKILVRWAYSDEVICKPERHEQGKGRGKTSDWPDEAVEEAAAVWAVRHSGISKPRNYTKEIIEEIRERAQLFLESPNVIHEPPPDFVLSTPNPSYVYTFDMLETKVNKDDTIHKLVLTWIAAKMKARHNEESLRNEEREIKSKIWKISDDPVKVIVHWHSKLMLAKNPLLKDLPADDFERTLKEEGVLEDDPPEDFESRYILRFRNVDDWLLRQECRIPPGSPTLQSFGDRYEKLKRLQRDVTYDEIDRLIKETIKDWLYIPTGWKFNKFSRIVLEASHSRRDELVVLLDDKDSREKALYAPFDRYDKYDKYDPEHMGHFY